MSLGHPDVAQGPEEYMELQVARQELATLVGVVEPAQKRSCNAILPTPTTTSSRTSTRN